MMKGLNNYDRTFHQFVTFCCHIQGLSRVMSHHEAMLLVTLGVNCNLASSYWSSALLAKTYNDIVCHQYTYILYIYITHTTLTILAHITYSHTSLTHHSYITNPLIHSYKHTSSPRPYTHTHYPNTYLPSCSRAGSCPD